MCWEFGNIQWESRKKSKKGKLWERRKTNSTWRLRSQRWAELQEPLLG